MDVNIAALIRQDVKTIQVRFLKQGVNVTGTSKWYTYVTDLDVKVGDFVVVYAGDDLKVVQVDVVDNECRLAPNDSTKYNWVVSVVGMKGYMENRERMIRLKSWSGSRIGHGYVTSSLS